MTIRSVVTALAAVLVLTWGGPASAQQAKCIAGKTKCMSKKGTGLLKCEATAETPGKTPDPNAGDCVTKVVGKFDGGADPTKGCFEKLENKSGNDCITTDDTDEAETAVDGCVASFVEAIDPAPITQTKCGAGKKKCVSKLFASLLKCNQVAQTPKKPTDPNANSCVDKATTKYTGGLESAKGCFAKLEAKSGNDCQAPLGNSATLQGLVESCADTLADLVTGGGSTTSTTAATSTTTTTTPGSTTTTTMPSTGLQGALPATLGRFNFAGGIGLPGALAQCQIDFPGTHVCTYAELLATPASQLMGLKDTENVTVTAFWAIDNSQPILQQCNDDSPGTGSGLNWEYGTFHTMSRGQKASLNNGTGVLQNPPQASQQCAIMGTPAWVGCCQ